MKYKRYGFKLGLILSMLFLAATVCFVTVEIQFSTVGTDRNVGFAANGTEREQDIDYTSEIVVGGSDSNGFRYGNRGGVQRTAPLISLILERCANANQQVSLVFEGVETEECLVWNASYQISLNGGLTHLSTDTNKTALTVKSGSQLRVAGLELKSKIRAIVVESGGELLMESGTISVNNPSSDIFAVVTVNGTADFEGGTITYEKKSASLGYGLMQTGESSQVTVSGNTYITGWSAAFVGAGRIKINGGNFSATMSGQGGTASGYALDLHNNAQAEIAGGNFTSVGDNAIAMRGTQNSSLKFTGGSVAKRVWIVQGSSSPSVVIGDATRFATVKASSLSSVFITPNKDGDLTKGTLKAVSATGYRCIGWQAQGETIESVSPSVAELPHGTTVYPKESNLYMLTADIMGTVTEIQVTYGDTVCLTDRVNAPSGYEITGWTSLDGLSVGATVTVKGDANYVATVTLTAPVIASISDIQKTYNGESSPVVIQETHPLAVVFTREYFKFDTKSNQFISVGESLTVCNVIDSGRYRIDVTATLNGKSSLSSAEFLVKITKAQYENIVHAQLEGSFDKNKTLKDYTLEDGYKWAKPTTRPTVDTTDYEAWYCLDEDNYLPYSLQIGLILAKADYKEDNIPDHPSFTGGVYDPDKQLTDYPLEEGFMWKDSFTVPTCNVISYTAVYNGDTINYNDYALSISIVLGKAQYENIGSITVQGKYKDGGVSLSELIYMSPQLPDGYRLTMSDITMGQTKLTVGKYEYKAVYNKDKDNYKDFSTCVTVQIAKGDRDSSNIRHDRLEGVYAPGKTLAEYQLNDGFLWKNEMIVPQAGNRSYDAIYNTDVDNWNNLDIKITVDVKQAEFDPADIPHPAVETTYRTGLTLKELRLLPNYVWEDEEQVLTAGNFQYNAVYTENENYKPCTVVVSVSVAKAKYDMSKVVFADKTAVYDQTEHRLVWEGKLADGVTFARYENNGHTDSGTYEVAVQFVQEDVINYELVGSKTAYLTILKAESVIVVDAKFSYLYDGLEKTPEARVENSEQTLVREGDTAIAIGLYTIRFFTVESRNYLAGTKIVQICINGESQASGDLSVPYTEEEKQQGILKGMLFNKVIGVEVNGIINFSVNADTQNEHSIEITLSLTDALGNQLNGENYTALILLPEELRNVKINALFLSGTEWVAVDTSMNGDYISIQCPSLGIFRLTAEGGWVKTEQNDLAWWAILLICIGCATVVAGGTWTAILLVRAKKRKTKSEKDV